MGCRSFRECNHVLSARGSPQGVRPAGQLLVPFASEIGHLRPHYGDFLPPALQTRTRPKIKSRPTMLQPTAE